MDGSIPVAGRRRAAFLGLALASFGSTRLGSPPRLRMAYSLPFDFGSR